MVFFSIIFSNQNCQRLVSSIPDLTKKQWLALLITSISLLNFFISVIIINYADTFWLGFFEDFYFIGFKYKTLHFFLYGQLWPNPIENNILTILIFILSAFWEVSLFFIFKYSFIVKLQCLLALWTKNVP